MSNPEKNRGLRNFEPISLDAWRWGPRIPMVSTSDGHPWRLDDLGYHDLGNLHPQFVFTGVTDYPSPSSPLPVAKCQDGHQNRWDLTLLGLGCRGSLKKLWFVIVNLCYIYMMLYDVICCSMFIYSDTKSGIIRPDHQWDKFRIPQCWFVGRSDAPAQSLSTLYTVFWK